MSAETPAALNAASRLGRSLASQRGEVVVSGRITPTSVPPPPPPLAEVPESSSFPQAATERATSPITDPATRRLNTELRPIAAVPSGFHGDARASEGIE